MDRKKTTHLFIIGAMILIGIMVFITSRKPSTSQQEQAPSPTTNEQTVESITNKIAVKKHSISETNSETSTESPLEIILKEELVTSQVAVAKSQRSIDELIVDAQAAMSRKAYDKAIQSLREAMSATGDPDERMRLGQMLYECLIRTHSYDDALVLGRELLTLNPTPQERLVLTQQLAALLHRMGKSIEAEQFLRSAAESEQDPATKEQLQAQIRGIWRHTEGRTDQVILDLTAKLEQNPQDEKALQALGNIYLKSQRDYEAALPIYEKLAALDPDDAQIQSTLLGLYRKTQNFDGMRRVYEERLAQAGGDDPTLRLSIAQTELQAGRGDAAVEYAEQHLSGLDATPFDLQMLSTVYDKAGRKDVAIATLEIAIERTATGQQRTSMQFQKADMLIWNKKYAEAESLLRSIMQATDNDKQTVSRVKSEIIRIYEMQGKLSELNL